MIVALVVAAAVAAPAHAQTADHRSGCRTRACDARVLRRQRRARWARRHPWEHARNGLYRTSPWLRASLARLRGCETRGLRYPANYRLDGHHDGAYQYDLGTWGETLAYLPPRLRRLAHAPAYAASPAEQDVRTGRFWPTHRGRWSCKVP